MPLKSNQEVYDYSIRNLEVLGDKFYRKEKIIISDSPDDPNELMRRNKRILELITTYKVIQEQENAESAERILTELEGVLSLSGINVSEFVTFWATLDVSFSSFHAFPEKDRRGFLKEAVESYISSRHDLYFRHGYTATTLQVRQDSFAHKASGSDALRKLISIFNEQGFVRTQSLAELLSIDKSYIFPDEIDTEIFDDLVNKLALKFEWSKRYQGKRPDAAFMLHKEIFLLEHKHKKEGGGGQSSQLSEIISFIQSRENSQPNTHYVSFLDGPYFNELVSANSKNNKAYRQHEQIKLALRQLPLNYFVNTQGFRFLIA